MKIVKIRLRNIMKDDLLNNHLMFILKKELLNISSSFIIDYLAKMKSRHVQLILRCVFILVPVMYFVFTFSINFDISCMLSLNKINILVNNGITVIIRIGLR